MKLSIIVPVYNSEKTIKRCLDSIARQSFSNYELIIINDGSKDNSLNIINEFIENNKHLDIKLINQENLGNSKSRQIGINKAKGEYVGFVDSDDYIDKDYYHSFFDYINNNDVDVVCSDFLLNDKRNKYNKTCLIDGLKAKEMLLNHEGVYQYTCNKVFKRELLNDLEYEDVCYIGEDFILVMQVLDKTDKVAIIDEAGYHYCLNDNSLTKKSYNDNHYQMYVVFNKYYDDLLNKCNLKTELDNYYILHYLYILVTMAKSNVSDKDLENNILEFVKPRCNTYIKTTHDSFKAKMACLIACKNYSLFKLISRYT